ncbi:MAG: hypothetical protein D6820_10860, partial [Lentisphaerae bacterium]
MKRLFALMKCQYRQRKGLFCGKSPHRHDIRRGGAIFPALWASFAFLLLLPEGRTENSQSVPRDNPVATYYGRAKGYPAWTDRIRWSNVIDMSRYQRGRTNFERFENARDELAAQGGGVLYYPAGTYDFSDGPFDGPLGRGLMLRRGIVIRGATPPKTAAALHGRMNLPTKFVFGFRKREAIDAGRRLVLELEEGDLRIQRKKSRKKKQKGQRPADQIQYSTAPLLLNIPVRHGKIGTTVQGFRRGYGRDVWPGTATVVEKGTSLIIKVNLEIPAKRHSEHASYTLKLTHANGNVSGDYHGLCRGRQLSGRVCGRFINITPETPRDWNFIGLMPEPGQRISTVDQIGICWVHLVGATIFWGPDLEWGETWETARSWKSAYVKRQWANRKPDGTHPWDPFAGGGKRFIGAGDGRLVFGCVLEQAAVMNDAVTMGRPDYPQGFGEQGYHTFKFGARICAYGSRIFIANNLLAMSRGKNFKYRQITRYTYPKGGAGMGFGPPRSSIILFDYNKTCGIDVNKFLLGLTKPTSTDPRGTRGYFMPMVVVMDNYVYNHGQIGFNISGNWVTIRNNRNKRDVLREGYDPERIGGWELTLDGHLESAPGGNGT